MRIVPLNSPEASDPRMTGTASELVAAVAALTAEAWRLARVPLPQYTRSTMPVAVLTLKQSAEES